MTEFEVNLKRLEDFLKLSTRCISHPPFRQNKTKPIVSNSVLRKLVKEQELYQWIAKQPNTDKQVLHDYVLSGDDNVIRTILQYHQKLNAKTLDFLFLSGKYLKNLVHRDDLTEEILNALIKDQNLYIRWAVASNHCLTDKQITELSRDHDNRVLISLWRTWYFAKPHLLKSISKKLEKIKTSETLKKSRLLLVADQVWNEILTEMMQIASFPGIIDKVETQTAEEKLAMKFQYDLVLTSMPTSNFSPNEYIKTIVSHQMGKSALIIAHSWLALSNDIDVFKDGDVVDMILIEDYENFIDTVYWHLYNNKSKE